MNREIQERVQEWLEGPYDLATKEEIRNLQENNPEALIDAFYRDLSFGTGGMRSLMGVGTNRMNLYTVRAATQGLADYLLEQEGSKKVFIGYDVRINSRLFAEETARVLAGNQIQVLVTREVSPTPLVSFGCRYFNCSAAVMITASHNPPEYNGYKVYWSDGGQIVAPHDAQIIERIKQIKGPNQVKVAPLNDPRIHWVGGEIDEAYLNELDHLRLYTPNASLHLVYTNLHGTGLRLIPKALERRGFSHLQLVEEQKSLDGSFPHAPVPNPEEAEAFSLGAKKLLQEKGDLLLATDPDADRIGVVVRDQRRVVRFNGHEIACLLLDHIATAKKPPLKSAFIKTIVTTELAGKIAERFGIRCFNVLTGFKNIARLIHEWERSGEYEFLFGAEESQGYLFKSFVRDKDAISAACLVAEMADKAKQEGSSLVDRLYDLYREHGVYRQRLDSFSFDDTPANRNKMNEMLKRMRENPPEMIGRWRVERLDDYLKNRTNRADVLHFFLESGGKLIIRPSGTEPKIKIYSEVCDQSEQSIEERIALCQEWLREIVENFKKRFRY